MNVQEFEKCHQLLKEEYGIECEKERFEAAILALFPHSIVPHYTKSVSKPEDKTLIKPFVLKSFEQISIPLLKPD